MVKNAMPPTDRLTELCDLEAQVAASCQGLDCKLIVPHGTSQTIGRMSQKGPQRDFVVAAFNNEHHFSIRKIVPDPNSEGIANGSDAAGGLRLLLPLSLIHI